MSQSVIAAVVRSLLGWRRTLCIASVGHGPLHSLAPPPTALEPPPPSLIEANLPRRHPPSPHRRARPRTSKVLTAHCRQRCCTTSRSVTLKSQRCSNASLRSKVPLRR